VRAAQEQGGNFGIALEIFRDVLYGLGVMWIHMIFLTGIFVDRDVPARLIL
jgi:hypothetical protein